MRVWLDDIRPMPKGYDTWCKTYESAIECLTHSVVSHIAFDHDLGKGKTGYDVSRFIEELAYLNLIKPMTWSIHTNNPVGRKYIEMAMRNADRYWERNKNRT